YMRITKEDVLRVYNKYIKNKGAVIISVRTKDDADNIAAPDNYTIDKSNKVAKDYGYKGLNYVKGKDNFDRSQVPAAGEAVVVKAPEFWTAHQGSIRSIGTETNEIPVVNLLLKFKGGQITDPANKQGLANLFATMMSEDTKNFTAEE